MSKLHFVDHSQLNTSIVSSPPHEQELVPCYDRCKGCSLFPYNKLSIMEVYEAEHMRSFNINNEQLKISIHGFRLICALTRYSGYILPKEFLIQYVWPESDIVRNNLNVAIYDLRILFRNVSIDIKNHRKEGYSLMV